MSARTHYLKHVCGSRYVYSSKGFYYRFPYSGLKIFPENDMSRSASKVQDASLSSSGRVYVNEKREMVAFSREGRKWYPYPAGKLDHEISFEGFDFNPKGLETGMIWTGLASHYGAKYKFNRRGQFYFAETQNEDGIWTTRKFPVTNIPSDLYEKLYSIRKYYGSIRINEYLHVFAPVPNKVVQESPKWDKIVEQFRDMTPEQLNALKLYQDASRHTPLYVGQIRESFEINRPDKARVVIDLDEVG